MTTKISYSLRHKTEGHLAMVRASQGDFAFVRPRNDHHAFEYNTESMDAVMNAMLLDRSSYSSSPEEPSWGELIMADYEIVEVTRTVTVKPVAVRIPVTFPRPRETRRVASNVASRYLGFKLPENLCDAISVSFVATPAGETFASLREKCTDGLIVLGPDAGLLTHCVGVFETPEEYVDMFNGKESVGLITY